MIGGRECAGAVRCEERMSATWRGGRPLLVPVIDRRPAPRLHANNPPAWDLHAESICGTPARNSPIWLMLRCIVLFQGNFFLRRIAFDRSE